MRMLLMPSPAAVSCPPTLQQLWTLPKGRLKKKRHMTTDKVMVINEGQRFTEIYIFPKNNVVSTPINFLNVLKVETVQIYPMQNFKMHKAKLKSRFLINAFYKNVNRASMTETLGSSIRGLENTVKSSQRCSGKSASQL